MKFTEYFESAESVIVILGTNPLVPHLEKYADFLADLLTLNEKLCLTILYESDSENFNQSLCVDTDYSNNRMSFSSLCVHRDRISGIGKGGGLAADIVRCIPDDDLKEHVRGRIIIKQVNLRLPVNLIRVDDKLWYCIVTNTLPTIDSYHVVEKNSDLHKEYMSLISFYSDPIKGGRYLSKPGEELIQMFDKKGYPRGIFPRACFYTTSFQRYSIWGFIFNRNGELLLHQRSMNTKDGRGLWDKSIGGHVDLGDTSTFRTAQRELVEELFLPEAEYSKYIKADIGDIIHFGFWSPQKRLERSFESAFAGLDSSDWIMFRATDETGEPLTVTRISQRRLHDENNKVCYKRTIFMSDIYLFIAPPDYIDNEDQMNKLLGVAEETGASLDHQLVTVGKLRKWIEKMEGDGTHQETFTDDLLYINLEYRDLLERFAEFIKYMF